MTTFNRHLLDETLNLSKHAKQRMLTRTIPFELIDLVILYGKVEFNKGCEIYKLNRNGVHNLASDLYLNHGLVTKAYKVYVVVKESLIVTVGYKTKRFKKNRK